MFITFEGIEGSGKSTAIRMLAEHLQDQGRKVLQTLEPGGSRLGKSLRTILLDTANSDIVREAELFMYLADRAQHVASVIQPALDRGEIVLCDRFADSTVVYQGYGREMDPKELHRLNQVATGGRWPDLTLLMDLPPEQGLKRAFTRNAREGKTNKEGRFEAESLAFHTRVREGYLTWAAINQERFHIVDATATPVDVVKAVIRVVEERLQDNNE